MDFWERLKASLRDDADVGALKAEFETFKSEQLSGVISNKDRILDEKKALQAELDELKQKYKQFEENEITMEMVNELQVENEALKQTSKSPEDMKEREKFLLEQGKTLKEKELRPEIEKLQKELEGTGYNLSEYQKRYQKYRVQNEIVSVLKEMNVEYDDIWLDGLLNKSKSEYNDIEDKLEIELYDPENRTTVPLGDWRKIFPNTVQGKKMIKAPKNVGGSASGGSSKNTVIAPKEMYSGMFNK